MPRRFTDKTLCAKIQSFEVPDLKEKLAIVQQWLIASQTKNFHERAESQCEIRSYCSFEKFWELDFSECKAQLRLKNLSLDEIKDLMWFFEKHEAEMLDLIDKIATTDREIDKLVFDLYGLSDEESRVVLNS